jgi:hypothetical protein
MQHKSLPALLALAAALSWALPASADWHLFGTHGSGVIKTEQRQTGSFDMILSKGSVDADVTIGPQLSVAVEADDNLLPLIHTEVKNGALVIDTEGNWTSRRDPVVHITMPSLGAIGIDGSGDATIRGLAGGALGARVRGSGDISASGSVKQLEVVLDGSGDVDCKDLHADDVAVRIDGSGDAKVDAAKTLRVVINGSGDVTYSGDAQVTSSIHGSGDLMKK